MTYCVGMNLDAGLVFLSDSRTNAGVDNINTFRKMNVFERPGERVMLLMTSGNLAITQTVVSLLKEQMASHDANLSLWNVPNMFEAARVVGDAMREVYRRDAEALQHFGVDFSANVVLGGQIFGEPPRLFQVYSAGNFIESTEETPYFQIGETKYGKPIIDRVLRRETPLPVAAKCALISMDSTIRSNLSVGLPLDLVVVRTNECKVSIHQKIVAEDPYFRMIRNHWGEALREAFVHLPEPDWQ
ncbi:proteasome-type protease [Uliginosibacterium sp. H1]|uniref:proteasome-type protease n=1 Tax=Uliginosibacterium sp. H1 TaxID=3114757 RepID=UPI002E18A83D|nr:proteasome-type protease [Uliginosibacterium sp. H1]